MEDEQNVRSMEENEPLAAQKWVRVLWLLSRMMLGSVSRRLSIAFPRLL